MSVWLACAAAALVVTVLRVAYVVGNGRLRPPRWFDDVGIVLGPAVTAAVLAPRVFAADGHAAIGPEAVAFTVAAAVAVRTRSMAWTLAVGMPLVWTLRAAW